MLPASLLFGNNRNRGPGTKAAKLLFIDLSDKGNILVTQTAKLQEHIPFGGSAVTDDGLIPGTDFTNKFKQFAAMLINSFFKFLKRDECRQTEPFFFIQDFIDQRNILDKR